MFSFVPYIKLTNLSNNNIMNLGQLFFFIIAFIMVLFLAAYITRLLATSSYLKLQNKNIKILESVGIGHHNNIQLIKVGERYVLIGNTKENVTLLLDLKEDEIVLYDKIEHETTAPSFNKYFNKYLSKKYNNKGDNDDEID